MLNPARLAAFRTLVQAQGVQQRFEGLDCRHVALAPGMPPEPIYIEAASLCAPTPPAMFGLPADPSCLAGLERKRIELPPRHWRRFENAAIIGSSSVLSGDNALYTPAPVAHLPSTVDDYDYYGFALSRDPLTVHFFGRPIPRVLAMDALFLANLEPGNYGSFLFRQLPLLIAATQFDGAFDCYVTPERTSILREALALLNLPRKPVYTVAEVCGDRFRSVLMADGFDQEGVLSAQTLAGIRLLRRRVRRSAGMPQLKRLYVSRGLTGLARPWYRPLVNEADIQALAETQGFAPCWPETLSFEEQISLFAGAKMIAGPSGSGMLNAIFAPTGSRVLDLESYQVTVRQHANLYSSSGKRCAFAFGTLEDADAPPAISPWRLDLAIMRQGLAWLTGEK